MDTDVSMEIGDYQLFTPDDPNPITLNKAMRIVIGLGGEDEDIVSFDYYLKNGLQKKYIYSFINPYSLLEGYLNPPYLAIRKKFVHGQGHSHQMVLDALLAGATVKQVHEAFGSITKADHCKVSSGILFEINSYYCEQFFHGDLLLYSNGTGTNFDLHTRCFPQDISVAIIILSSTPKLLAKALDSLVCNTFKKHTKIHIGWCGEDAGHKQVLKTHGDLVFKWHWPLKGGGRFNYAKLHNSIVRSLEEDTSVDYYVLMNDDVEIINHNFLEEMLFIAHQEDAAIVGASLYFPEKDYEKRTYQHGGVFLSDKIKLFEHFARKKAAKKNYVPTREVSAVTFALVMVHSEVYHQLLLDEKFYGDCNDIDFCLRAREAGYKIWYSSKAVAWHVEAATRNEDPAMQNDQNSRIFYKAEYARLKKAFKFL